MKKSITRSKKIIQPPRHTSEHPDQGQTKKGVICCRLCSHIFYKKEWRDPKTVVLAKKDQQAQVMSLCAACFMKEKNLYEGEITIEKVPKRFEMELKNLVNAFGKRAMARDSQHRILELTMIKDLVRITTTENQLAIKLAKKITEVFRGAVSLCISYSKEPYEVNRVKLVFA